MHKIYLISLAIFFATSFVLHPISFLVVGCYALFGIRLYAKKIRLYNDTKKVFSSIVFIAVFYLTLNLVYLGDTNSIWKHRYEGLHYLFFIFPITLFVSQKNISENTFFKTLLISTTILPILLVAILIEAPLRDKGLLYPAIGRGNMAILGGMLALISGLALKHRSSLLLGITNFIAGCFISVLSESRGGWLAFFGCLITVGLMSLFVRQNKNLMYTIVALMVLIIITVLITWKNLTIESRISLAMQEIFNYYDGKLVNTSVGVRLEMWRIAFEKWTEKPFFGWGFGEFKELLTNLAKNNKTKIHNMYSDPHNDYLLILMETGIFGFISFLTIYIYPLYIWIKKLVYSIKKEKIDCIWLPMIGIVSIQAILMFSLTNMAMIAHEYLHLHLVFTILMLAIWDSKIAKSNILDKSTNLVEKNNPKIIC